MGNPHKHPGARCCDAGIDYWRIADHMCNYSAFNGYHWTYSAYSRLFCLRCRSSWRTNAKYVSVTRHATPAERKRWLS